MTPERIRAIIDKLVMQKYINKPLEEGGVQRIYNDISAVIRGLKKTENFLGSVSVDTRKKTILVGSARDLEYLGFLPYLFLELQKDQSLYLAYQYNSFDNSASLMCGLVFKDLYNSRLPCCDFGFDVITHNIHTLGIYYPDTNEFRRIGGKDM